MNKQIAASQNPLTITLPAWVDTNHEYILRYSVEDDEWVVAPF